MKSLFIGVAIVAITGAAAHAADLIVSEPAMMPAPASDNSLYLSVHGGWLASQSSDVTFFYGGTQTGVVSTESGYRLGGAIGMSVTPNLSIEGEVSYTTATLDEADIEGGSVVPVDGDASTLSLMANAILGSDMGGWTPYVGVGVGAVNVSLDIPAGTFGLGSDPVDDNAWTWGAQAMIGVDFDLTDSLTLGGRYRYQYHGDTDFNDDGGDPVSLGAAGAHSLELVGKIKF